MKFADLQKKNSEDLKRELETKQVELLRLQAQVATGAAGKTSGKVRDLRRNIARIHTLLNQKSSQKPMEGMKKR